ncbi:MAG: hypothetical protein AAGA80_08790 [Cyanobacteria bacterium P01_F01_bin.143]
MTRYCAIASAQVIEAEVWIINEQGNVVLVAQSKSDLLKFQCF